MEKDKWVKITILKHMISIYGSHFPGDIATVPRHVASNWAMNGIAEWVEESIPAGTFWCSEHLVLHKLGSRLGKRCLKRQAKAKAEEAAATALEPQVDTETGSDPENTESVEESDDAEEEATE